MLTGKKSAVAITIALSAEDPVLNMATGLLDRFTLFTLDDQIG
jgi:hypothetical protein